MRIAIFLPNESGMRPKCPLWSMGIYTTRLGSAKALKLFVFEYEVFCLATKAL